jgi:hypothetical protein
MAGFQAPLAGWFCAPADSLVVAPQPLAQPAVAAVGQDRENRVQVHIQPHFARQAVEVEEVHADPQPILHPVAPGVADDHVPRRLLRVVRQEQRPLLTAEAVHGQLADRALIAAQLDRLVDVTDRLVAPPGRIQHGAGPGRARQRLQPAEDRGATPPDGDEVDAAH